MFFDKEYNSGTKPLKPFAWIEPMKQEFYKVMGWDPSGRPSRKKLKELNLCRYARYPLAASNP
jgi:aldehyde:ferredoxin oxidoreductase